ncbi:hypothetical protein HZ326_9273 [Fusarium oxysporum f. sp. albedinis]|nr:hypothetical protein HZ326_9273 [Fusarium oxysporum f. sp. albedinis]
MSIRISVLSCEASGGNDTHLLGHSVIKGQCLACFGYAGVAEKHSCFIRQFTNFPLDFFRLSIHQASDDKHLELGFMHLLRADP